MIHQTWRATALASFALMLAGGPALAQQVAAPGAMKEPRRTKQPGTARNPAPRNSASPQPSNFDGTLSHHGAPFGPPVIGAMSLRRKESSTAFLSH